MPTYTDVKAFKRDWWPKGTDSDITYIQSSADGAFAYINSMLGNCYTVPFTPTPGVIELISDLLTRMIVEYIVSRGRLPRVSDIRERAEKVLLNPIEMLEKICKNEMDIPGEVRRTDVGAWVSPTTDGFVPVFELDHEFFHEVDPDKLEKLEDDRRP